MTVNNLLYVLDEIAPFETAEKWDNVGLLVGSKNNKVGEIFTSLDISLDLVRQLPENSTLITHHPLIFKAISVIDTDSYNGAIINLLLEKKINYISMHTNFDKAVLNEFFICDVLEVDYSLVSDTQNSFLKTFTFDNSLSIEDLVKDTADKMNAPIEHLKFINAGNKISKVGVCTGSGSSLLKDAIQEGCDVLMTGDITHHVAMEALDLGISLIDITHYYSENCFASAIKEELEQFNSFQDIDCSILFDESIMITTLDSKNPFSTL